MNEIMTPEEVAALLHLHVRTVYRLARQGKLPGRKVGSQWRFLRENVLGKLQSRESERRETAPGSL